MKVIVNRPDSKDAPRPFVPTIFLAGPCYGARNWHDEVVKCFENINDDRELIVCIPKNDNFKSLQEQCDWETYWLNAAYTFGLVAFYLAEKEFGDATRGFARTTRFELGEWVAKYDQNYHKRKELTIGIEDMFEGKDYIIHRLTTNYGIKNFPSNIEDFCKVIYEKLFPLC